MPILCKARFLLVSAPRGSVLAVTALLGLAVVVPTASAGPAPKDSPGYRAWLEANRSSRERLTVGARRAPAGAKPAPAPGGQVITTTATDTNGDGTVDGRFVITDTLDKKGRVVRRTEVSETGAAEVNRLATFEYDKSGNLVLEVNVSNDNDLGAGGDGSVFERVTTTIAYVKKFPVLRVVEVDQESNGTLEWRSTTTYVNDTRGNALQTATDVDQGANGTVDIRLSTTATYDQDGRLIDTSTEGDQPFDGTLDFRVHETTTYDAAGNRIEDTSDFDDGADGTIDATFVARATYDAAGHLLTYLQEADDNGDGSPSVRVTGTLTYGAPGELLEETYEADGEDGLGIDGIIDSVQSARYEYDAAGNVVRQVSEVVQTGSSSRETSTFEYDADGRVVSSEAEIDVNGDGTIDSRQTVANTYDSRGRLVRQAFEGDFNADGTIDYTSVETTVFDGVKR